MAQRFWSQVLDTSGFGESIDSTRVNPFQQESTPVTETSLTTSVVVKACCRFEDTHRPIRPPEPAPISRRAGGGGRACVASNPVRCPRRRAQLSSHIRRCRPNISSVTTDHDDSCELPEGRRVAYSFCRSRIVRTTSPRRHSRIQASPSRRSNGRATAELFVVDLIA